MFRYLTWVQQGINMAQLLVSNQTCGKLPGMTWQLDSMSHEKQSWYGSVGTWRLWYCLYMVLIYMLILLSDP